ncbi:MAG: nucleotidyltransferase substrate binding protein [Anaerolineales bacterium]
MERLKQRLQIARQALTTLLELTSQPSWKVIERDAMIQRFEYTFEATWKAAQVYLRELEGVIANFPKSAVRLSWQTGLFDEQTARMALQMCEARNMTIHAYNEKIATSWALQIREYSEVLQEWLIAMEKHLTLKGIRS